MAMGIRIGGLLLIPYTFLFYGLAMWGLLGFGELFNFSKFKENIWPSLKFVLLASVLGTLRLALGTAAGVTVLLLSGTLWGYLGNQIDATAYYVQAALSGVGYFAIALLASQLSTRLASEGQRAHMSQLAARIQQQVNELVIESLPDGVLIVDEQGIVRGANPSARQLLGVSSEQTDLHFNLKDDAAWLPLLGTQPIVP